MGDESTAIADKARDARLAVSEFRRAARKVTTPHYARILAEAVEVLERYETGTQ